MGEENVYRNLVALMQTGSSSDGTREHTDTLPPSPGSDDHHFCHRYRSENEVQESSESDVGAGAHASRDHSRDQHAPPTPFFLHLLRDTTTCTRPRAVSAGSGHQSAGTSARVSRSCAIHYVFEFFCARVSQVPHHTAMPPHTLCHV